MQPQARDWRIFINTIFFVLGFSVVFSLVGVLLQTVLAHVSVAVQEWLGRIGGLIIIVFGLFTLGLITPGFLQAEHKLSIAGKFRSQYATSFLFGAAFAVGWTPCVSAALGAILALAATQASSAFLLLFAYTLGIGIPFLLVGLFTNQAQAFINRASNWLAYIQYVFGALLIVLGVLIFVGELSRIANFQGVAELLSQANLVSSAGGDIHSFSFINLGIAFLAGLGSFLSPCILPIVPGFLSYLASTTIKQS